MVSPKVVGERSVVALVVTAFVSGCFARSPHTSSNPNDPERAAANPLNNRTSTLAQAPRPANAAACERELRSRLTQEFGSQIEITVNSAEIYFTSNAEQGIRGIATVIFQSDNRAADYRYDCTVNLRTGTVSQLTYQRINQTSPTPSPGGSSAAICERTLRDRITVSQSPSPSLPLTPTSSPMPKKGYGEQQRLAFRRQTARSTTVTIAPSTFALGKSPD